MTRQVLVGEGDEPVSELMDHVVTCVASMLGTNSNLGGTVLFDFGIFGAVFVDGTTSPGQIHDGADLSADCHIKVDLATFARIAAGVLDAETAYRRGKIEIAGDSELASQIFRPFEQRQKGLSIAIT